MTRETEPLWGSAEIMSKDATPPTPGSYIVNELGLRGWKQRELAEIIGRPFQAINEIINGKRSITADTAIALGAAFDQSPELWLGREAAYQVSQATTNATDVRRRARLFGIAPVWEMQKRGWMQMADNTNLLEAELRRFFSVESLDDEFPQIGSAMKKTETEPPLTPSQWAWCCRVRQLAKSVPAAEYKKDSLESCKLELRNIVANPQDAHKVPEVLSRYGIRFVIVEPLPGSNVDGFAMWLNYSSPVIGLSLRYDRIDSFWHTLCHELSHIAHRDEAPLDVDLTDQMQSVNVVKSEIECRAEREAAEALVPADKLNSFILGAGPRYSKERIIEFAQSIKMHPGIIVGQLRRRNEIGFYANLEMLSKIRQIVTAAAYTDGWGSIIDTRTL